ncbi:MAG: site-specific DNA-methyltransferase [Bacteroidales bacterium]|nr:site-specific DNA-methyltransferase [Bacteroidales bacterium]
MVRIYGGADRRMGKKNNNIKINHLYHGDCIEILHDSIEEETVDLIFADPPYNLSGNGLKWTNNKTGGNWYMVNEKWDKMTAPEYLKFTRKWIGGCHKALKNGGSLYVSCSYHNVSEVMIVMKQLQFKINNIITWQKTNAMPNMTRRVFTHSAEFVVWGVKGEKWIFNYDELRKLNPERQKDGSLKQMRDVWQLPLVQGRERIRGENGRALHPTQKPEELLRRIIPASSNIGDLILDPFVGSGTTAVVAKKLGRNWIGIDNNLDYVKISEERIGKISGTNNKYN